MLCALSFRLSSVQGEVSRADDRVCTAFLFLSLISLRLICLSREK
jgi:hypothetical protein